MPYSDHEKRLACQRRYAARVRGWENPGAKLCEATGCTVEFRPRNRESRYCGKKCAWRMKHVRAYLRTSWERACDWCRRTFRTRDKRRRFCRSRCTVKWFSKHRWSGGGSEARVRRMALAEFLSSRRYGADKAAIYEELRDWYSPERWRTLLRDLELMKGRGEVELQVVEGADVRYHWKGEHR